MNSPTTETLIENSNSVPVKTKNSQLSGVVTIFKAAIGLGIMTNPIFFAQSGWVLSTIMVFLICYLVAYTMMLVTDIAYDIEKQNPGVAVVQLEDTIPYFLQSKNARKYTFLGKILL